MGTILDDDDLDYLNINLNESNIEDAENNISTKRGGKKKDKV
jgi:hypothetical protein